LLDHDLQKMLRMKLEDLESIYKIELEKMNIFLLKFVNFYMKLKGKQQDKNKNGLTFMEAWSMKLMIWNEI